jgi:aryl-alcohol dehydrogenase-like predicted oxidoreductase
MAYGTLGFGLLSGTFTKDTEFIKSDWRSNGFAFKLPLFQAEEFEKEINVSEKLKNIAQKYGKSLPQMAIAWTLGHPDVSVGLVGVRNEKELKENASAVDWIINPEIRAEIDQIFAEEGVQTHINTEQAV